MDGSLLESFYFQERKLLSRKLEIGFRVFLHFAAQNIPTLANFYPPSSDWFPGRKTFKVLGSGRTSFNSKLKAVTHISDHKS